MNGAWALNAPESAWMKNCCGANWLKEVGMVTVTFENLPSPLVVVSPICCVWKKMTTWAFTGNPSPDTRTAVPPAPLVGFTKTEGLPGWVNDTLVEGGGVLAVLLFHGDQANRP